MLKEFFELDIRFHVTPPLLISFAKCLFNHRDLRFIFLTSNLCLFINTNLLEKRIKFHKKNRKFFCGQDFLFRYIILGKGQFPSEPGIFLHQLRVGFRCLERLIGCSFFLG